MIYNSIIYEKASSIAKIILNTPDTGNTLDLQLAKELYNASLDVASDDNIKALILTANGKLFCGGGNLKFLLSKKKKLKNLAGNDYVFSWELYQEWLIWPLRYSWS